MNPRKEEDEDSAKVPLIFDYFYKIDLECYQEILEPCSSSHGRRASFFKTTFNGLNSLSGLFLRLNFDLLISKSQHHAILDLVIEFCSSNYLFYDSIRIRLCLYNDKKSILVSLTFLIGHERSQYIELEFG